MTLKKLTLALAIAGSSALLLSGCDGDDGRDGSNGGLIKLRLASTFTPADPIGAFDESAAEIVAYDRLNQRLFVVNANDVTVDVLDIADVNQPALLNTIDASLEGGAANSVAVNGNLLAVAIEANTKTDNGKVVFYDTTSLARLGEVTVGALPDMVTFTPDGSKAVVANEGEPNDDYSIDPEGSVSVIDLSNGVANATVSTASFVPFNGQVAALRNAGVRIFGPNATVAQDLEPEYVAISADGSTAFVSLQENNALALVDIDSATVSDISPLGFKNHNVFGNELDVSNKDDRINIRNWPVLGMYQPDTIASYSVNGESFIVTANEGDARDYDGWTEEFRVKDLTLTGALTDDPSLQDDENLGRLRITSTMGISNGCDASQFPADLGDLNGDLIVNVDDVVYQVEENCEYDALYSYGARSFSIWNAAGELVFDSGNDFERITAMRIPADFNSTNDENDSFDSRSDDKGPEPEALALGKINGQTYAFIGLERVGGIMVYNISNPEAPQFVQYITSRDFSGVADLGTAGDLAPEGMAFINASDSPSGKPLLAVGNEVSGTTSIFEIDVVTFQ